MNPHESNQSPDFPLGSIADWRRLVEEGLSGRSFEESLVSRVAGLDLQPLYTEADFDRVTGREQQLGAMRATSPLLCPVAEEFEQGDPEHAVVAIRESIAAGVTWISLCISEMPGSGSSRGGRGLLLRSKGEFERLLEAIPPGRVGVGLGASGAALEAAAAFLHHAREREVAPSSVSGCLGLDPLGVAMERGLVAVDFTGWLDEAAAHVRWAEDSVAPLRVLSVDTSPYHDAGADAAEEVAFAVATGLEYVRALSSRGCSLSSAARRLSFEFCVTADTFLEIAKLRAARVVWAKVMAASGGDGPSQHAFQLARPSRRTAAERDAWQQVLRATSQTFAAVVGGADVVLTGVIGDAWSEQAVLASRLSRNTQHILREEAHLAAVGDPAGGSYYVETLTDRLARRAWEQFAEIEREGGMRHLLADGALRRRLEAAPKPDVTAASSPASPAAEGGK